MGCSASRPLAEPTGIDEEYAGTPECTVHQMLGLYTFVCSPSKGDISIIPLRESDFHLNALKFLETPPYMDVTIEGKPEFNGNILNVDIGLRNPLCAGVLYTGFDVCGIVFTHGSVSGFNRPEIVVAGEGDMRLLNADGWTRWWNPKEFPHGDTMFNYKDGLLGTPAGSADFNCTINGYKYFADGLGKDQPVDELDESLRGMFTPGKKNIRHYKIDMTGGLIFNYAIDACWKHPTGNPPYTAPDSFPPDANRAEPYGIFIVDSVKNSLYFEESTGNAGGEWVLDVWVYDWFNADLNTAWGDSTAGLTFVSSKLVESGEGYGAYELTFTGEALKQSGLAPFVLAIESEESGYGGILPGEPQCWYFAAKVNISEKPFGVRSWGGGGWDMGLDLANDSGNLIYTTGYFCGTVDFDPDYGIEEHTSQGGEDIYVSKFDGSGCLEWAITFGGNSRDAALRIVVEPLDPKVYVTGLFYSDKIDLDPGPGVDEHINNGSNSSDAFLCEFDWEGDLEWGVTWGGPTSDEAFGAAIDDLGNIYITGYFSLTVDFNPGPDIDEHTSNGGSDIFLSKFNKNGEFQWVKTWGGSSNDCGRDVAVSNDGDVYVLGYFSGTVDFDPGPGIESATAIGKSDVFLSKFDSDGNFIWVQTFGGNGDESGNEIAIHWNTNIYITGHYTKTVDFDPGPGTDEHSSNGNEDIFLCKYDSNGIFQWARVWGAGDSDYAGGVAVDDNENVILTGYFRDKVDFDPGPGLDEHSSYGGWDIFLTKLDSNGDFLWAKSLGGPGDDICGSLLLRHWIYLTGAFSDIVDFDPGVGTYNLQSNGSGDIFLCKLDPDGKW